jgi:protease-4
VATRDEKPRRWRRWILAGVLIAGAWWFLRGGGSGVSIDDGSHLFVDIGGVYQERTPDDLVSRLAGDDSQSLADLLFLLRGARDDTRVDGMVVRIRGLRIGWAKAQEIRSALAEFRASGKRLVAYLECEFGNSTLEYFIASAAAELFVPPAGQLLIGGLLAEYMFLGGVWEQLDIEMQVVKIGEYKTAGDMYERKSMSAAHREMADSLLDSLYAQFVSAVADARDLDEPTVRALVDRGPMRVDDLEAVGLVDGVRFLDEIKRDMVGAEGKFVGADQFEGRRRPPVVSGGRVAVVYGVGMITTGESAGGLLRDESSMGADTLRKVFEEISDDDTVDAIVFRIDSPGGSALASDLIWRATQQARSVKPVIVSMSDVAGSGGYYVAAGASEIFAAPGTLTGSIGVVLAKPNIRGLLGRLGVETATLQRGEAADMASLTQSFDAAELASVRASMAEVYTLFLDRVASGRSMEADQVDAVGRGRVWTGEQARDNGLIDELGGLLDSIDAAKRAIGLNVAEKVEVVFYPRSRGLFERLADALTTRVATRAPVWLGRLRGALAAFEWPDGSILTLMPQQIEIR